MSGHTPHSMDASENQPLRDLPEAYRAFITLSITDIVSIFTISKIIQELSAESIVERGDSSLGQVLKYLSYQADLGAEYFKLVSKEYPPNVPVTAYDVLYVRAKAMCRGYTCMGALVYDIFLVFSHYKYVSALFKLSLDILPRIVNLFCKSLGSLPVVSQVLSLYPLFEFSPEVFKEIASSIDVAFLAQLRKGREHKTNLELLADYLESRDAFDAELATLEPSLNRSVRFAGPIVPIEHQQALIMLLQEFTEEQVNELEDFLLDTAGLELDGNKDLILDFSAIPVDKMHMVCEQILKISTQDQQKISAHRVHVLKTLVLGMK